MSNAKVRLATEADVAAIISIRTDSFLRYAEHIPDRKSIRALTESPNDVLKQIKTSDVYIYLLDEAPCGTIRISYPEKGVAKISRFGVLARHLNAGIGRELLQYVLKILDDEGIETTYLHTALDNSTLVQFYELNGFNVESVSEKRGYRRGKLIRNK